MKPLRILIYDTNFVKGSSRMIPILKIKYWQKHNCKITILCTNEGKEFYQKVFPQVDFITINFRYQIKNAYSLPWEYIKITTLAVRKLGYMKGKFDVVYSQSAVIDFLFVPCLLRIIDSHIRWFVMVDNLVPPPSERPGPFLKKFLPYVAFLFGNLLLKKSDGIFVVTDFLKTYYLSGGYTVVKTGDGYGIDTEIFTGKISKDTPSFDAVYTGRLHEAKGVFDLLEVMREVVKKKKNFVLGIMGDGEDSVKERFQEKINEYHLEKNIVRTGYVSGKQKGDILRNASFFIFLSYDEGCPHAVIEAFANNKLVVGYNLPIYHSVFKTYIDAKQLIVFPQKRYAKIADYIVSLNKNKLVFRNNLEDFTWDTIVVNELRAMTHEM